MLALDAGVTAVIGLGSTPGGSNLLAQLAVRELDRGITRNVQAAARSSV